MTLTTRYWGNEISWSLYNQETSTSVCSSKPPGTYGWYSTIIEQCTLFEGIQYKLHCKDTYGDGWHGGYITIQGERYCNHFCPDPPYCYGQDEWNNQTIPPKTGGALFVQTGINISKGICI